MQKLIKLNLDSFDIVSNSDNGHGFSDSSRKILVQESSYVNKLLDSRWIIKEMISQNNRNGNPAIILLLEQK